MSEKRSLPSYLEKRTDLLLSRINLVYLPTLELLSALEREKEIVVDELMNELQKNHLIINRKEQKKINELFDLIKRNDFSLKKAIVKT
jgi:hypothetical protein